MKFTHRTDIQPNLVFKKKIVLKQLYNILSLDIHIFGADFFPMSFSWCLL